MTTHTEFLANMETQIKKWDADVETLRTHGKTIAADARAAYFSRIKELHATRTAAQSKFVAIRCASEAAGAKLQSGMEGAWETMRSALEKVSSELPK